ncbi:MAG: peptide ABC transporter substrate-binding protein [Dehalococcoidia bacterium]|jgi:oligopeptide transport system substrate-binding protein|nr:peptide ABC transporter substrate-binding protein [Dehalococcoidia bacterium]
MFKNFKKSNLIINVILAVFLMIAVTSCGSEESASSDLNTPIESTGDSDKKIAPKLLEQKDSDSLSNKEKGGVLKRLWADPATLDPHLVTDTTSAGLVVELFSGLVSLNSSLEIVPELAESWEISDDGKVYTFKLRDGILFSDGSPITARDFKWSFERAAHPDTESPVASIYLEDIVGSMEVIDGDGSITDISGVKIIDDSTLQITIDAPKAYFLAKLTYPTAYVLKKNNVDQNGDDWTDSPIGTGPFVMYEYRIGEVLVIRRNDYYWGEKARLDGVEYNLAGGQAMSMYENDEIDITGVGLADLERVKDVNDPLNSDLVSVPPSFTVSYIGFNVKEPPFDDLKFRLALNYAVDKQLIASQVYSDLVKPAYGILPPNFPGFSLDISGIEYDPDKAAQLLSESKYADASTRPPIVVTVPGTGGSPSLDMEVVSDMWDRILGVQIEIQQVEWATYLQDLHRRRLQVWGGSGWQADYPDPQDFIDILFHTESTNNHGNYSNTDADKFLEDARTEQDIYKRISLYNKAEQLIIDDAPWLPMWFDQEGLALIKPWVKGFNFTPMIVPKMKEVYIDKS